MKILPEYITINEDVIGGKPVIAGTRIPVPLIIEEMAGGMPIERIMEEYDLTREGPSGSAVRGRNNGGGNGVYHIL